LVYRERVESLRQRMARHGFDCIFLAPGANLYYFTGLEMGVSERSSIAIIPASGPSKIVVPELEARKAEALAKVDEVTSYRDEEGPASALGFAVEGLKLAGHNVGFEYRSMRVQELELIRQAMGQLTYGDAGKLFASLRATKDEQELEYMAKACAIVEAGMESALAAIKPGASEFQVQAEIEQDLRRAGVMGHVQMSVASGERSGSGHNSTSGRTIMEGDLVWVDLMVSVEGYYADITRTFPVGRVSHNLQEIYQVVLEAQQATRERAEPGMTGREIDAIARGIIESRGFGEYFTHRTGHGLGLEIHEEPYIVASNETPLEPGMTFTIEPGIYLPGEGGVRIEDDVVLVPNGCKSMTNFRRNLLTQKSKYVV